ncbi:hypothetical protein LLT3_14480 [Lactococcus cremoris subsp. cremoris TIFN3]|jgi:hypothetical protein|uniref:Uncharacterized protein n=1 Tax=Lactococcus cremoris subsp. cremoris TIFN3 TaxID=1234873 RepID=T0WR39_LACLC|nr:hypothetical protein LLT3_14800 [Lactococcus cremoris subsp. cremoris TIFN3]EQC95107.1 hypothetical protein LLT3_14605 [Lactococcus cremoris subsp. cremoris TIFN3]EQC95528.1 hypothetical protein LLT3_14480 [Lactococcus cremoris subsp. cremoris TIFN3]
MNKTILELSRELNITKKKLQNKIYFGLGFLEEIKND